ncbi:MAG: GldG family protein [Polyangiaceae bacterium]|nr:GldG family protein [Polyangiaceae bacterium]
MAIERKTKAATETGAYLLILLAVVVGINTLSHGCGPIRGVYARIDATRAERFTLSKGSGRLLATLKQPMDVDVYVTRGLAKLDAFVNDLEDLLKEYERAGAGKLRYKLVEAKTDEQREAAKEAGLKEAAFGEGSETGEDQASIKQGFMGIVFKYGSEKDAIPILSPERTDGLEFWITNKIREIRDKADNVSHRIGVLTGKDEIKLSDANLVAGQGGRGGPSMRSIIQQALPFYKFEDVDLKDGETQIDEGLVGLIVTQPGKSFNDKELRRIDQFVMRGRSLVVVAGAANMKASDASMKATLDLHGLDKLLTGYGLEVSKDVAMDWGRLMRIPLMTQSGALSWVFLPGIAQVQHISGLDNEKQMLDNGFAGFFRLEELAFPFPSSLVLHADKQPEAVLKVVARTSPRTTVATSDSVDLRPSAQMSPKPPFEQRAIAAFAEGKLKRAVDPPKESDGIEVPEVSKEAARVLVIASPQFLANPFARAGQGPDLGPQFAMMGNVGGDEMLQAISQPYAQKYMTTTILAFKNTLDWMAGDSDLIAASAKILGDPNLTYSNIQPPDLSESATEEELKAETEKVKAARKSTQTRVQWSLTLLLPTIFAAFGIVLWQLREKNRSNISLD